MNVTVDSVELIATLLVALINQSVSYRQCILIEELSVIISFFISTVLQQNVGNGLHIFILFLTCEKRLRKAKFMQVENGTLQAIQMSCSKCAGGNCAPGEQKNANKK